MDAVPHHSGDDQGRRAAKKRSTTIRPTTRAAARFCAARGRGMVFGDVVHDEGLGRTIRASKSTVPASARSSSARTEADNWEQYIDVIAASIADNSGRSCVNASGVWTPRHARRDRRSSRGKAVDHRAEARR